MFFIPFDNWKTLFFIFYFYRYPVVCYNRPVMKSVLLTISFFDFSLRFFFFSITSFSEGIIHAKVLFKADIENAGTPGCIKHIKK